MDGVKIIELQGIRSAIEVFIKNKHLNEVVSE